MPRRLVAFLSLALALVLAAGTVALATGGSSGSGGPAAAAAPVPAPMGTSALAAAKGPAGPGMRGRAMRGHGRHGGAMMKLLRGMLLKSSADRLGVEPAKLQAAVKAVAQAQFAKKAAEAKLTAEEIAAVKACRRGHLRGAKQGAAPKSTTCDGRTARAAVKKLRALPKPDLAALKTELSDALGKELGLTGATVLEAARAELVQRLDQGVSMGFVKPAMRTKVLACFDTPTSCDVKALHRQLRRHGAGRHRGAGRHHGGRGGQKPAVARRTA